MGSGADVAASMVTLGALALVILAHVVSAMLWGARPVEERVAREEGLPLLGHAPMQAVYRALLPVARAFIALGIGANAITLGTLAIAAVAAALFATGHFGLGAAVACVGALGDAVDGFVARETKTTSRFGQLLDTTVDRYVDALLLGGVAVFVRQDVVLLVLVLGAIVGGFMVSYASSVLREIGVVGHQGPMRRAHRLAYVLGGAVLVPFSSDLLPGATLALQMAPLVLALAAIAVLGNVSSVRRLLVAARHADGATPNAAPPTLTLVRQGRTAPRAARAPRPIEPTGATPETAHR